jgi:hypothetical protein
MSQPSRLLPATLLFAAVALPAVGGAAVASAPAPSGASPAGPASSAATPAPSAAAGSPVSPDTPPPMHRIQIPGPGGKTLPYSIELPPGWQAVSGKDLPGVFLGPPGMSKPENDPRAIYVRASTASLADPSAVVANIRKNEAGQTSWTAPIVEVREVGGVHGVLVRMDSGAGAEARSTMVLKMPYGQSSLDFMVSAQRDDFERRLAGYQRLLFSLQPAH